MTKILDGKSLSKSIRAALTEQITAAKLGGRRPPGLGVVLVGDDAASRTYVASKERQAIRCGFTTKQVNLASSASREEVADALTGLNEDEEIDGILLQLPLPRHLDSSEMLALIDPEKDADGLHTLNQGRLVKGEYRSLQSPLPCTPYGCMKLIDVAMAESEEMVEQPQADLSGLCAVVIGRSILVGKPLAQLLLERNATVTMVHSRTPDPASICQRADILCAASGVTGLVTADWVKEGGIVIDVGINRTADGKLVGDVLFEEVKEKTRAITPVPGGVGPMTVATLLSNTFSLYQRKF